MKTIILFLFILYAAILPAQNYKNICSSGTTCYKDKNLNLKAFQRDSIHIPVSGDTIFISYRAIRDTSLNFYACKDTTTGSVLGRKIYKKSNGWFYLFNNITDTVKINSQAALNESWKYCLLSGGAYIQATVTSIVSKNILGANDLVKIITFQAKNSSNTNISNILNGKKIELSQHYGLTKTLDTYYIPNDTTSYFLAGKADPPLGIQVITAKDIYNFDIGDVFHYHTQINYNPMGQYTEDKINHVLDKTVFGNYDSVRYQMESCTRWNSGPPQEYGTSLDTIIVSYNLDQLSNTLVYQMLPDEFERTFIGYWPYPLASSFYGTMASFNQRQTKGIQNSIYQYSSGCWIGGYNPFDTIQEYTEGLGLTNFQFSGPEGPTEYESLVYFNKGSETWGTPVATDCNTLVGVDQNPKSPLLAIQISPNPVESRAEIVLKGYLDPEHLHLILYNIYGSELFHSVINTNPFILNRKEFPAGCYILTIIDNNADIKGRTKIIFD